ncbi:MAG: lysophospholipid acyltransferase family protein [Eubacteriales bacterium]|jgi:1-acyl-sn-glycerol-3-phosphate acyltransferase
MLFNIYFFIVSFILRIFCRIKITGAEYLPDGNAIVCGNHTSMLDPIVIAVAMYRKRRFQAKFMAKIELSRVPVLSWLIKPLIIFVDRGNSDRKAIKDTIDLLRKGEKILIFPEGRRVDVGEDSKAKTGVAMMSIKSGAPLVPVYLTEGRKNLLRFPKLEVSFGKPYYPKKEEGLSTSASYRKIADDLMERIRLLKGEVE